MGNIGIKTLKVNKNYIEEINGVKSELERTEEGNETKSEKKIMQKFGKMRR